MLAVAVQKEKKLLARRMAVRRLFLFPTVVPLWLGSKPTAPAKASTKRGRNTLNNVPFSRLSPFFFCFPIRVEKRRKKRRREKLLARHYWTQFRLPNV